MNKRTFFLSLFSVGIMLLNDTAIAYADWSQSTSSAAAYSGQILLSSMDRHDLSRYDLVDPTLSGGDALFGSTSVQAPVTYIAGANIEIKIMNAGEKENDFKVNNKDCPANKDFHAFVSPIATCSAVHGRNFSGFRAVAQKDGDGWKPMLYMNANGRWISLENDSDIGGVSNIDECRKLLVQKICQ